jgi:hypothetical protein
MTTGRINQVTIVVIRRLCRRRTRTQVTGIAATEDRTATGARGPGPTLAASRLPPSPPGSHRAPSASTSGRSRGCCVGAHVGGPGPGAKLFSDASGRCPPAARRHLAIGQASAEPFRRREVELTCAIGCPLPWAGVTRRRLPAQSWPPAYRGREAALANYTRR